MKASNITRKPRHEIPKILILNGARMEDKHLEPLFQLLTEVLDENNLAGTTVKTVALREIQLHQCIGCFSCWLKTPGKCIHTADAGSALLQELLSSNIIVFFTPVVFGGYSSELKKLIDRFLPMALPFFEKRAGELHHPRRYATFPHIVGIGIHPNPTPEITKCFQNLVGRNAVNANTSYSADVFCSLTPSKSLSQQFVNLLSKTDKLPHVDELNRLTKAAVPFPKISIGNCKALLIIGSPKRKTPCTSTVLGGHLLNKLKEYGWKTEALVLQENLLSKEGQYTLLQSFDTADTVLAAFPLYLDTLPAHLTKAFEIICSHRKSTENKTKKNFLAVLNSGFPETYQSNVALTICHLFAMNCGMTWAGGLIIGAGEQLISGNPLQGFRGFRGTIRPPLLHAIRALDITAASLAEGCSVPQRAVDMLSRKPLPLFSFTLWSWFLMKKTNSMLTKEAKKNGITKEAMYSAPYSTNE